MQHDPEAQRQERIQPDAYNTKTLGNAGARVDSNSGANGSTVKLWLASTAIGLMCIACGFTVCVSATALQPLQQYFGLCGPHFACAEMGAFVAIIAPGSVVSLKP